MWEAQQKSCQLSLPKEDFKEIHPLIIFYVHLRYKGFQLEIHVLVTNYKLIWNHKFVHVLVLTAQFQFLPLMRCALFLYLKYFSWSYLWSSLLRSNCCILPHTTDCHWVTKSLPRDDKHYPYSKSGVHCRQHH